MVRRVPFQLLPVGEPFLDQFAGLRVMDGTAFHDHFGRPHCAPPGPTSKAAWVCFPGFPISNKTTTRLFSTGLYRWTGRERASHFGGSRPASFREAPGWTLRISSDM